eukprot:m.473448 g.473448  ORF g.473448 m.473448 type:complete len:524 (+) comp57125_c0_seq4:33-1604(+)
MCFAALLSLLLALACGCANAVYPTPPPFPAFLYTVNQQPANVSLQVAVESLRGKLSQTIPQIFVIDEAGADDPTLFWLHVLTTNYSLVLNNTFATDPVALITHFAPKIQGYFLCNTSNISVNMAASLLGIHPDVGIVFGEDLVWLAHQLGLPLIADTRALDPATVFRENSDAFNGDIVVFQDASKSAFLNGFAVFARAFSFFDTAEEYYLGKLAQEVFSSMNPLSALLGWGTSEIGLVQACSRYSIFVNAADWTENLDVFMSIPAHAPFEQPAKQTAAPVPEENVHTVTFIFTDGDNIDWMLNGFASIPTWYGSPERGQIPLGWTISPALSALAPALLESIIRNESVTHTGKDVFIASSSGVGYAYPSQIGDMTGFAQLTSEFMSKTDLNILNVIDLPHIVPPAIDHLTAQPAIDAVFYYAYSDYSQLNGSVIWSNGKPVFGGRANLWSGFNTPAQMADLLLSLDRNVSSQHAYSVVPVHAWSMNVSAVIDCVERMSVVGGVRVVAPDDFLKLFRANVNPPTE